MWWDGFRCRGREAFTTTVVNSTLGSNTKAKARKGANLTMLKFTGTIRKPGIDVRAWKARVITEMREQLKEVAHAWLEAAMSPIPTWSGASLGTFSDLASEVEFSYSISPTSRGRVMGLGPAEGAARSTGVFGGDDKRGEFFFEYTTTLEHLIFNEFNNANTTFDPHIFYRLRKPGPYRFQEKGRVAALAAMQDITFPLPTIKTVDTRRI